MNYTSVNNPKIKELKKLKEKKYRDQTNLFLVEGYHLVNEAYNSKILKEVIILENTDISLDIPVSYATKEVLATLSDTKTPQNIIGVCSKLEKKEQGNKIIILDDIQDPGNLGTIIRSAVAFNFDTIILSKNSVDLYNPKVIRSSQGMIFKINIMREELNSFVNNIKDEYQILTTDVNEGKNIKTIEKRKKICIIMGNEGNGVSDELTNLAHEKIYIPISSNCESLNVGVATSILLYELGSD